MAPDKKDKKRKVATGAGANDAPAKKTKPSETSKEVAKPASKNKKTESASKEAKPAAAPKANGEQPKRQAKPRKRAADFLSSDEEDEASEPETQKKQASNKKTKKDAKEDVSKAAAATAASSKKGASKAKKPEPVAEESGEDDDSEDGGAPVLDDSEDESEGAEDDQTAALIKGFESSGDEDASEDEGFDSKQPVPKVPDSKKAKRKILKKQKKAAEEGAGDSPGVVYVGRIPHGFYEHQMRAYFTQFGDITRLRLSRNRITGRSKHYAFVEFSSAAVAKIVAETMDNYLMYGHILKCKYIPAEQIHPELWKGANRRFKQTPWNRIEKKRVDKAKTRDEWTQRIGREQKKRLAKAEKLKSLGYEIDLPLLTSVDRVPVQVNDKEAIEGSDKTAEEPAKAIEAPSSTKEVQKDNSTEDDTQKKSKKQKKGGETAAAVEKEAPKKDASEQTTKSKKKSEKKKAGTKA